MNIPAPLLDAALNGDPLAKCQVSDILEEHGFKRWPELKLLWQNFYNGKYSRCVLDRLSISLYQTSDERWTTSNNVWKPFSEIFNTKEEAQEFLESNLLKEINKYFVRE